MSRELILYVGLHKTASSSIQATCAANQSLLRAKGFAYPIFTMEDGEKQANHTRILRNLFRRAPDRIGLDGVIAAGHGTWTRTEREKVKAGLAATLLSSNGRAILAAEGMSTYSFEELTAAREWLISSGFEPRVICHVRHLSSWLNSMIAQRVSGQLGLTIAEAIQELVRAGGLVKPRIEVVRSVFPGAEFFSHETAVAHRHGPAGFFLETAGVEDFTGMKWKRANDGASELAVRTRSLVNERFGRARWQGPVDAYHRFTSQAGVLAIQDLPGPKFKLLESEAQPLMNLIASENAWLLEKFGQALHDPDPAFPREPIKVPTEATARLKAAVDLCESELKEYLKSAIGGAAY
jgi:hypothetical protein